MTIHFFTFSGPSGGSSRQRAFKVVEQLRQRGMSAVIHTPPVLSISTTPWPGKFVLIIQTIRALTSIRKNDIVFLQRTVVNKYFFLIMVIYLFIFRRNMIFDFDDPVYVFNYFKTKIFAQMADAVITCTHRQAEWARQYNNNVHVIHIALDHSKYKKFSKDYTTKQDPLVIGWVGDGPKHIENLEILAAVFRRLVNVTHPPFTFRIVGVSGSKEVHNLFGGVEGLNVEFVDSLDWTDPDAVPREVQKFDIGVLPHQSEGEWNKAKTTFKVLEYMACGVPSIASAFGEIEYIISDGENGFIASSTDEWVQKLLMLLSDSKLRERFGRSGTQTVVGEYSFEAVIPRLMKVVDSIVQIR